MIDSNNLATSFEILKNESNLSMLLLGFLCDEVLQQAAKELERPGIEPGTARLARNANFSRALSQLSYRSRRLMIDESVLQRGVIYLESLFASLINRTLVTEIAKTSGPTEQMHHVILFGISIIPAFACLFIGSTCLCASWQRGKQGLMHTYKTLSSAEAAGITIHIH